MSEVSAIRVQRYLEGVEYSASEQALLERAPGLGADGDSDNGHPAGRGGH